MGTTTSQPYFVYNGSSVKIGGGVDTNTSYTFSISNTSYVGLTPSTGTTASFFTTFYLNSSTGAIESSIGDVASTRPALGTSDVVIGFASYSLSAANTFHDQLFVGVGIGGTISAGAAPSFTDNLNFVNGVDYSVTNNGDGSITVTFLGTDQSASNQNYTVYRRIRRFRYLVSLLDSTILPKMTMIKDVTTKEKLSLENASISNIKDIDTSPRSFKLSLGVSTVPTDIANGNLVFYKEDNELFFGQHGIQTKSTVASATYGVMGKYSSLYTSFFDGLINTGDNFYSNLLSNSFDVIFTNDGVGKQL